MPLLYGIRGAPFAGLVAPYLNCMNEALNFAAKGSPLVAKAIQIFRHAHGGIDQRRKYTGEPYTVHTEAVADLIAQHTKDPNVIAAGCGHEVIEDVPGYGEARVCLELNHRVGELVAEVTNQYTTKNFPKMNRAERQKLEVKRLAGISPDGKLIKLADVAHNVSNIEERDPEFARVYMAEKAALLPVLRVPGSAAHEALYAQAEQKLRPYMAPTVEREPPAARLRPLSTPCVGFRPAF